MKNSFAKLSLAALVPFANADLVWLAPGANREDHDPLTAEQLAELGEIAPFSDFDMQQFTNASPLDRSTNFDLSNLENSPLWEKTQKDSLSVSPFHINDMSYEEFKSTQSVQGKMAWKQNLEPQNQKDFEQWTQAFSQENTFQEAPKRHLFEQTSESQVCKYCIDDEKRWCPTSNYSSGYCCEGKEWNSCPRAGMCSDEFELYQIQYWLCPNEDACTFSRNLAPNTNGQEKVYEQTKGKFYRGDLCSFKVAIPYTTDLNDVMYFRIEYLYNTKAILIKGENLVEPIAIYEMYAGQTYTATKGINLFLLFEGQQMQAGDFVFTLWYQKTSGSGELAPNKVTYEGPDTSLTERVNSDGTKIEENTTTTKPTSETTTKPTSTTVSKPTETTSESSTVSISGGLNEDLINTESKSTNSTKTDDST